jgi:hypothetical protein
MKRRTAGIVLGTIMMLTLSGNLVIPQDRQQGQEEMRRREHPRMYAAISALEDSIAYMESSREGFGGHKRAAIRASQQAVRELQAALRYAQHQEHGDHRDH